MNCDLGLRWPTQVPLASTSKGKGKAAAAVDEPAPLSLLSAVEALEVERCVRQAAKRTFAAQTLLLAPGARAPAIHLLHCG